MYLQLHVISGLMFGVEFLWNDSIVVVDIGVIRMYIGIVPKEGKKND